jgi:hypothetical protein
LLTAAPQFLTPWIIISDSKSRLIMCKITFKCASSLRLTPVAAAAVLHLFVFFFSPFFAAATMARLSTGANDRRLPLLFFSHFNPPPPQPA